MKLFGKEELIRDETLTDPVLIGGVLLGHRPQMFSWYTLGKAAGSCCLEHWLTGMCVVSIGLCTMDDFDEGDFSLADDALLEGCLYEDDCICAPDFTTDDYVRVTELYYDRVVSRRVSSLSQGFLLERGFCGM